MKQLVLALVALLFSGAALAAVNLNTASRDELIALPGIGPAKAQAIVDYRTSNGPFKSVDDVRKVKGIGDKLFAQIRPELVVTAPAAVASAAAAAKADPRTAARTDAGRIAKDDKARK